MRRDQVCKRSSVQFVLWVCYYLEPLELVLIKGLKRESRGVQLAQVANGEEVLHVDTRGQAHLEIEGFQ